jgi:hypothetical protein
MTKLFDSFIKCSLLVVLTLFTHTSAFSQIEILDIPKPKTIAETKAGGQMHIRLEEWPANDGSEVSYRFVYKDFRYPTLYSLETFDIPNHITLTDLKGIILGALENTDKKFSVTFMIDEKYITVQRGDSMGLRMVRIMVLNQGFSNTYTKGQWERFFQNIK